jgi:hypothetical protein
MLVAFVFVSKAGSFLLEDLYKLNLATEQLWIFLAFFLACMRLRFH